MNLFAILLLTLLPWLPQETQETKVQTPPRQEQPDTPPDRPDATTAPKHRLQLSFAAREVPFSPVNQQGLAWEIRAPGQEKVYTFDSSKAQLIQQPQYFAGRSAEQASGNCWYARMEPADYPEKSLRVLWWEVKYRNGDEWIAGAILNEALDVKDLPIGRLRGKVLASIDDGKFIQQVTSATIWDQTGCVFEFGKPQSWVHPAKLTWYTNRFGNLVGVPPDYFWGAIPRPDAQGGNEWKPEWTPYPINLKNPDGSWVSPKYWNTSDPRNPPIGQLIGDVKVGNFYADQTHSHFREGAEGFRAPWEAGYIALGKVNDYDSQNAALNSLWWRNSRQTGRQSPTNAGFIDGRPNHLALLNGELFTAGKKYAITPDDKAAPFTGILQEGKPQIGKSGHLFWECYGRSNLHFLDLVGGQFKGLYMSDQGSDFEHCCGEPLLAGWILMADPLAARQLHHICEEYVTKTNTKLHSTRSDNGWKLATLCNGFLAFYGNPTFGPDAERYRNAAFQVAANCWQARFDESSYRAAITVGYEYQDQSIPEPQQFGYESTMQLGVALHATTMWYLAEPDPVRKKFWLAFATYLFECADQEGIIDWKRGGIIQRYGLHTPHPSATDPRSPSELVEAYADPRYQRRENLGAEGWLIDAIAEFYSALPEGPLKARAGLVAKQGYEVQKGIVIGGGGLTTFNPRNWSAWGTHFPLVQAFGFQNRRRPQRPTYRPHALWRRSRPPTRTVRVQAFQN